MYVYYYGTDANKKNDSANLPSLFFDTVYCDGLQENSFSRAIKVKHLTLVPTDF